MRELKTLFVAFSLAVVACGGAGPDSCAAFAADLRERAETLSGEELTAYVDDTAQDVARLISEDSDDAQLCADAILEVLFTAGLEDAFSGFED